MLPKPHNSVILNFDLFTPLHKGGGSFSVFKYPTSKLVSLRDSNILKCNTAVKGCGFSNLSLIFLTILCYIYEFQEPVNNFFMKVHTKNIRN